MHDYSKSYCSTVPYDNDSRPYPTQITTPSALFQHGSDDDRYTH